MNFSRLEVAELLHPAKDFSADRRRVETALTAVLEHHDDRRPRMVLRRAADKPSMVFTAHAITINAANIEHVPIDRIVAIGGRMTADGFFGNFGQANYSAAKLGIVGLSKSIALDMQRFGVRSNAVAPWAWTRMIDSIPTDTPEQKARVEGLKKLDANKIAPFCVALCSDAAADVTGQIFGVRNNEAWIDELLDSLGLSDKANANMRQLSGGMKRRVLVAQALVHKPRVIVLDEPTAGMSKSETLRFIQLIRQVTEGETLLTVEHDMGVVFGLADKIAVVVYGEVIAFDTPDAVRSNPKVQEAYLGSAQTH